MRKQAIQKPIQLKELAAIRNRSCIPSVIEYIDSKTQVTVSCIKIQEGKPVEIQTNSKNI